MEVHRSMFPTTIFWAALLQAAAYWPARSFVRSKYCPPFSPYFVLHQLQPLIKAKFPKVCGPMVSTSNSKNISGCWIALVTASSGYELRITEDCHSKSYKNPKWRQALPKWCSLSDLEWCLYFERTVHSHCNTCVFGIILSYKLAIYYSNTGVRQRRMTT